MREVATAVMKTGSGSMISMTLGAVASKILALITGPSGIGLYSMIQQLVQTTSTAAIFGGGDLALIRGIASSEKTARDEFVVTVFWLFAISGTVTVLALILMAPWIAALVLGSSDLASVWLVRWTALPVALMVCSIFLNAVLNGHKEVGRIALVLVAGSAVNVILAYPVSVLTESGYPIAFVGMMTVSFSIQIIVALSKAHHRGYLGQVAGNRTRFHIKKEVAKTFFTMAGTLLITGTVASISLLLVRALIVRHGGLADAGVFNVAWVICMAYPMIILGSFGTYYFPTLSQMSVQHDRVTLMREVFQFSTILFVPLEILMIVFKPLVVDILYSEDFYSSLSLLRWMLVGVYLKAASWVLAMPMFAFADMKTHFWTGNLWYVGFIGFSFLGVAIIGNMEIIGVGFVVVYAMYFGYSLHYAHSRHGFELDRTSMVLWISGLAMIILVSAQTWFKTDTDLISAFIWSMAAACYLVLSLMGREKNRQQ